MTTKKNPPDDSPAGIAKGRVTTQFYHSAESIAHHYRPGVRPESGYFKIPCPAHRGDGKTRMIRRIVEAIQIVEALEAADAEDQKKNPGGRDHRGMSGRISKGMKLTNPNQTGGLSHE